MGRARGVGYAGAALVVLALGIWAWGAWGPRGGTGAVDAWKPDPNVIAVAPFKNLTGDPVYADLAERIAMDVERRLSGAEIGEVRTADRVLPSIWTAGEGADPIEVLSQELGAGTVVTGILDLRGDSLEIQAYCTDAVTGNSLGHIEPVWGPTSDQQTLVSRIQDRVAGALALRLDPDNPFQSTSKPPLNPDAYAEYRRAVELSADREDWEEAADHLLRAWALDPTYLDAGIGAFVKLHEASQLGANRWGDVDSVLAILDGSVDRMTRAQRHSFIGARALLMSNDVETAMREIRLGAAEDPIEWAYDQGHNALFLNRTTEAVQAFQRWQKGEGEFLEGYVRNWPYYFHQYADALHRLGLHEQELEIVLEGRRRFPDHADLVYAELITRIGLGQVEEARPLVSQVRRRMTTGELLRIAQECFAHGVDGFGREILEEELRDFEADPYYEDPRRRAEVLHMLGRNPEALAIYRDVSETHPDNPWQGLYQMGIVAASLGDTALALEIDRRIAEWPREAGNPASFPLVRAQIHANLGNLEEAFRLLDESYFRYGRLFRIENHAIFDLLPLQGYPPYDELMRGVG